MRFAVDDFVVGYTVGIATKHTQTVGAVRVEAPIDAVVAELQPRLSTIFPSIDVDGAYRGGSTRLAAGLFFGLNEQGEKAGALFQVYESMSPLAVTPETLLRQLAHEFGASFEHGVLVHTACEDMRARYNLDDAQ